MESWRLAVEYRAASELKPYGRNARTHSKKQIRTIADSIRRFGFTNPVLISETGEIIAGHGRVAGALLLGMAEVPTIQLAHLTEGERRAYVLADNKLALNAGWDQEILAIEFQGLIDIGFDVTVTGFTPAEIDLTLDTATDSNPAIRPGKEDEIPTLPADPVSRRGDVWSLGRHRLLCGDAREAEDHAALLNGERVDLIFTDPPYNVSIDGHVCGLGHIRHRPFAMAVGEMSEADFTAFLTETLGHAAAACRDGAIAFVCIDWRHLREIF